MSNCDLNPSTPPPVIKWLYSNIKGVCSDCKGVQQLIMLERRVFCCSDVYPDVVEINSPFQEMIISCLRLLTQMVPP